MGTEPTTVTLPATKGKGYGRNAQVTVNIAGRVSGTAATLAEAKATAVEALIELATVQQSGAAATIFHDGETQLLTAYYPSGTGTAGINFRIVDGSIRVSGTSVMSGTPADNAARAAQQPCVTRVW